MQKPFTRFLLMGLVLWSSSLPASEGAPETLPEAQTALEQAQQDQTAEQKKLEDAQREADIAGRALKQAQALAQENPTPANKTAVETLKVTVTQAEGVVQKQQTAVEDAIKAVAESQAVVDAIK